MAPELEKQIEPCAENEYAVEINNGEFYWETCIPQNEPINIDGVEGISTNGNYVELKPLNSNKPFSIRNINFKIPSGQLWAIVGSVGSGKSSLLNSLIGETKRKYGIIKLSSKIGYAPQQAW